MWLSRANGWTPWSGRASDYALKPSGATSWPVKSPLTGSDLKRCSPEGWCPGLGSMIKRGMEHTLLSHPGGWSLMLHSFSDAACWIQHSGGAISYDLYSDVFSGCVLQPVGSAGCNSMLEGTASSVIRKPIGSPMLLGEVTDWAPLSGRASLCASQLDGNGDRALRLGGADSPGSLAGLSRRLCSATGQDQCLWSLSGQGCRVCSAIRQGCSLPGTSVNGDSPGKNTGMGCHALLQGIFPTQGSNPGLPHGRQTLNHLNHKGNHERTVQ